MNAISEGRYTFPPPPGYITDPRPKRTKLNPTGIPGGIHIPDPLTFEPFQRALRLVAHGINTPGEALRWLNASEFAKHRGHMKLDKFIKHASNPYYAGILHVERQVTAHNDHGLHEPMIEPEEHKAILEAIHGRPKRQYSRLQFNPDFPLRKLAQCECGSKFTGAWQTGGSGNRYPRYRCLGCGKQYHRDDVHGSINALLATIKLDPARRKELLKTLVQVWQSQRADALRDIERLEKDKSKLLAEKSNLVKSLAKLDEEYQADIKEELDKTKLSITAIEHKINSPQQIATTSYRS